MSVKFSSGDGAATLVYQLPRDFGWADLRPGDVVRIIHPGFGIPVGVEMKVLHVSNEAFNGGLDWGWVRCGYMLDGFPYEIIVVRSSMGIKWEVVGSSTQRVVFSAMGEFIDEAKYGVL